MASHLTAASLVRVGVLSMPMLAAAVGPVQAAETATAPVLAAGHEAEWFLGGGPWALREGALEQPDPEGYHVALLREPAFADFALTVEFRILPTGNGVRAAAIAFRASGTMTYYWAHLDSKNNQVILVHSTPDENRHEIARRPCPIAADAWHTAQITCTGQSIVIVVDGKEVLTATDATLAAGRVGVGTSQGQVVYRNLRIEGAPQAGAGPLRDETPPPPLYRIISRGEAAGPYQAFPDACRLQNGDILCVFYAGYGHVSLPTPEWPRGGRICLVRSRDEGRTWSAPEILFDDALDNRDPHIAEMSDGSLVCSFFALDRTAAKGREIVVQVVCSRDGGRTWDTKAQDLLPGYACSAPVRELPDGTRILGTYYERDGKAWGGVIRSTDRGATWSSQIDIGKESGVYLDAETDVILRRDGSLYAALRSSNVRMHYATSSDQGLTWSPAQDIGFPGHAPHFTRLSTGEVLLTHRVPQTALHVSRDDCQTWAGPYILDRVGGAYPATVELKDGTVLAIYYTEGSGSHVRALRFRLAKDGIEPLPLD
jgi:hypothetical protein